jgi:hypothetical protein
MPSSSATRPITAMALIKLVIDARKTRETGSVGGSIR